MFGNGKTALKFNLGHYLDAATNDSEYTSNSPATRIVRMASRNWGDTNNNKVIDCDIMNFAANGECAAVDRRRRELRRGIRQRHAGEPGDAHEAGVSVKTTGSGGSPYSRK